MYKHVCKYSLVSVTFSFRPDEAIFELTWLEVFFDLKSNSVNANWELHIYNWIRTE